MLMEIAPTPMISSPRTRTGKKPDRYHRGSCETGITCSDWMPSVASPASARSNTGRKCSPTTPNTSGTVRPTYDSGARAPRSASTRLTRTYRSS